MRWALLLALPLSAQVHVTYTPIRIGTTQAVFGPGKSVGFWRVSLDNRGTNEETESWEKILSYAPRVPWYPNQLGQDLAARQASRSGRAILGSVWDSGVPIAGSVSGIAGLFLKSVPTQYAGAALVVLSALVKLLRKGAPDPTPYFSRMLPDQVSLQSGAGATFYAASGPMHDVQIYTSDIPPAVGFRGRALLPPGTNPFEVTLGK